jgi:protein-tyrosine kinase
MRLMEKALNRLKPQEKPEVQPLGQLRGAQLALKDQQDAVAEPDSPGTIEPDERLPAVSLDRLRMKEEGFLAPEQYQRRMADEYRRIKRPLIANAFGIGVTPVEKGNLVLITSAVSGEGKTHTCINLALSLAAERDRTVLLVDGDVPKPHISRLFGVADEPGLLDALDDHPPPLEQLLIRTDVPHLAVLPAGRWRDHATELLASTRMHELCIELAVRYPNRIVLFDSPPLLAAPEAQAISATVGQVVLVVTENVTAREDVRAALALLDEQMPVNAILNKSRVAPRGGYYYGGGYGYGAYGDAARPTSDGTPPGG